jgi:hypothetical protein
VEPNHGWLNEKGDGRAENEGPEEVAEEKKDGDGDDERRDRKRDLQVSTAPLWIDRPGRNRDSAHGGRVFYFSLAGRFPVRAGTHVTHSPAV